MNARRMVAGLARRFAAALDPQGERAVEETLRSQVKFRNDLFDAVPLALALRDHRGNYAFINRTWEKYFNARRETVIGQNVRDRMTEEEAGALLAQDRRALARGPGAVESSEFHFRGKHLLQTRTVMAEESGKVIGVLVATLDVTERRAMEEQLHDQMTLTRALIDENPNAMYLKDTQGRYVQVNDAWLAMVGVRREQAIGRNVLELFPEKESERYHAEDMRLIAQGAGFSEMESLRTGPGGKPQWVIIRKTVLRRADGTVVGLIGTNTDITDLKRIETELADRAKFVSELVDALPISVAMRDAEGRYMLVNRTWERYFGVERADALGKRRRELPGWQADPQRLADADEIERFDRDILARGPDHVAEPEETVRLGRYYLMTRRALFDSGGNAIGVLSAGIDLTERRAMEERLRDQIALTQAIVERTPNALFVKDAQGRFTMVNRGWSEMSGIAVEKALGRSVYELYPPELARRFAAEDERLIAAGAAAKPTEALHQGPQRKDQWRIVRKAVLTRPDGSVQGLIGSSTDISEMKRIEEALATEQRRLDLVVRASRAGIVDWDGFTHATYYSPRFREILGHAPDADTSGWPDYFRVLLHPDDRERFTSRWQAFIKGKGPEGRRGEFLGPDEHRLLRKDGSYVWVEVNGVAVRNEKGWVTRWIAATNDITERRAMEERLTTEQRRLALVVHAAKVGILDWDGVHRSAYYSPRFKEILGYAAEADTSGWPDYFELIHPEDRDRVKASFRAHIVSTQDEFHAPIDYRLRRADGEYVWVQAQGVSVRDEKGYATRFIASLTDITERRAYEEALKETVRLREEVERMSRHDLKTPLNSVIAVSRLLRENAKLSADDEELLSIVERAGYRILSMVNLSLDLFRMEQGTYQFRPQAVDLAELAHKVAADLEGQAASKGIAIRLRQSGSALARAEELLTYSMLANIVKNAIEAEPEGGVVSVTVEGAGPRVSVHVHNSGVVPTRVRERFFEKYATSGKSAGLGLGTYSARLMARVQEGDITLHSEAAQGTTVSVRLRSTQPGAASEVPAPAATATRAERLPQLPALRVLVVDDDEFNRLVLRRYLPNPPITLAMAVNGRAALDAARREWPDVVLLDLEMPVMDGYEAAARLREMERERGKRCRIIAISSNDDSAIIARALAAGCDHYLVKPAARETLWALLAGGAAVAGAEPEASHRVATTAGETDAVELDADLEPTLANFLASRRALIDELPAALQADRARFKKLAHKLAGSFSLYGFRWAAAQCRALETAALEGHAGELARHVAAVRAHLETATIRVKPAKGGLSA